MKRSTRGYLEKKMEKGVSLFLVLLMLFSMLPAQVFAEGETPVLLPDLTVRDITIPPGDVLAEEPVSVTAAVYNAGSAAAGEFSVALYSLYDNEEEELVENLTVSGLALPRYLHCREASSPAHGYGCCFRVGPALSLYRIPASRR